MWFLKNRPNEINMTSLVESQDYGYQLTNLRFCLGSESSEKIRICVPFPWAPHKPNGGLTILNDSKLEKYDVDTTQTTILTDVQIIGKLRSIRNEENIEMIMVHDLISWHVDNIGVFTCWVEPNVLYSVNYRHKLAGDSQLFLPTRLPIAVMEKSPKINWKCWVVDGKPVCMPRHIKIDKINENVSVYYFNEWGWNEDTRIGTYNWASSDDESS